MAELTKETPEIITARCQICGARHDEVDPILCRVCGEPVLRDGWAP